MNKVLYRFVCQIRNTLKGCDGLVSLVRLARSRKRSAARSRIQTNGLRVASKVTEAMMDANITCFLSSGALLGLIREGHLLAHDDDVDFFVIVDESFSWKKAVDTIQGIGFEPSLLFTLDGTVTEVAFTAEGFSFDIFGAFPLTSKGRPNEMRLYTYARRKGVVYDCPEDTSVSYRDFPLTQSTEIRVIDGYRIVFPTNAIEILEANYGASWSIPDPSWDVNAGLTRMSDVNAKRIVVRKKNATDVDRQLSENASC